MALRRRHTRLILFLILVYALYLLLAPSRNDSHHSKTIKSSGMLDRISLGGQLKALNPQKHSFLQVRVGREEDEEWAKDDVMGYAVRNGANDFWDRYQVPSILGEETKHTDSQMVRSALEDILSLNGWVASSCPTLMRPFQRPALKSSTSPPRDKYESLTSSNQLYYIAIVIHSADHFLVDQLATIVQLAKKLGPSNIFVSMLDYYSTDATPTLLDMSEAVLTLLGVPFRIRRVEGLTVSDATSYYPFEEAYTRNLALEPLHELWEKRKVRFSKVIWLKGFTCPQDVLETLLISNSNSAALVCGMDWAERNSFFIFSDRWRTRDILGDQFRQSRSTARPPPREVRGAKRYEEHLPFQVFCCESGTHVVDPALSYYRGVRYRSATTFHNISLSTEVPLPPGPEEECMDSSQAFFCRDLWTVAAREGLEKSTTPKAAPRKKQVAKKIEKRKDEVVLGEEDGKKKKVKVRVKVENDKQKRAEGDEGNDQHPQEEEQEFEVNPEGQQFEDPEGEEGEAEAIRKDKEKEKELAAAAAAAEKEEQGEQIPIGPQPNPNPNPEDPATPEGDPNVLPADHKEDLSFRPQKGTEKDPLGGDGDPDSDANRGSDYDALPEEEDIEREGKEGGSKDGEGESVPGGGDYPQTTPQTPNHYFTPARILVNPRCVTTYAGVSHTQLARDLFEDRDGDLASFLDGDGDDERGRRYVLDESEWEGAPESFICQEQRHTGGRQAQKTQRRLGFSVYGELKKIGVVD